MSILLINPPYHRLFGQKRFYVPTNLVMIANTLIANGFDAIVYNADADNEKQEKILSYLEKHNSTQMLNSLLSKESIIFKEIFNIITQIKPSIIGITVTSECVPIVRYLINEIHSQNANIRIILGGPHFIDDNSADDFENIEIIFQGESELELVNYLLGKDICSIKLSGNKKIAKCSENYDLNLLPTPTMDCILNQSLITKGNYKHYLHINRGCPFNCHFCISGNKSTIRTRTIENVIEEINLIRENYDINSFYITDDTFAINEKHLEILCNYFKSYKSKWSCMSNVKALNSEKINKMGESGCKAIHVGIETYSQRMLDIIGKNVNLDRINEVCTSIKMSDIELRAFIMVGLEHETNTDRETILEFCNKFKPDEVAIQTYLPYPGTVMYSKLSAGIPFIDWKNFNRFDYFENAPYLSKEDVQHCHEIMVSIDKYNKEQNQYNISKAIAD